jgi:alpha-tubulin suppressor-like RCC1 family protein
MEDPCIIMPLLNSQIVEIKANHRFTSYLSTDGSLFVMGRDFRPIIEKENDGGSIYGIPKFVRTEQKISQIEMGQNHMLLLSKNGALYSIGSNDYG